MPVYTYSSEKNLKLIQERNISFEEIIVAIENDLIWTLLNTRIKKNTGIRKFM
jgi:hypothetical protein